MKKRIPLRIFLMKLMIIKRSLIIKLIIQLREYFKSIISKRVGKNHQINLIVSYLMKMITYKNNNNSNNNIKFKVILETQIHHLINLITIINQKILLIIALIIKSLASLIIKKLIPNNQIKLHY